MTDQTADNAVAAAAFDDGADPGEASTLDFAAIDASTVTAQSLAFMAPDGARPFGEPNSGGTVRVSTSSTGGQSNGASYLSAVTGNGRFVAFDSFGSNLVPNDTNGNLDVFVKDLRTGRLTRVSTDAAGNQGNAGSDTPSISADGRFVAFDSFASNLVPGDANNRPDVIVKDLRTGRVTLASADAAGNQGNDSSYNPSLSGDGRSVAFISYASNLVPGDANNEVDVFVKDLRTGRVTLASADAAGNAGDRFSSNPSLSADGRFVAFTSLASNLVPGDTNENTDVFVKDLRTGRVTLVSADAAGNVGDVGSESGKASISADGRYVAFDSGATNLLPDTSNGGRQVFVKDLRTGKLTLASADAAGIKGDRSSAAAAISPNGRFVAFSSFADNLVAGDAGLTENLFVKDLWSGGIREATASSPGYSPLGNSVNRASVTNAGAVVFNDNASSRVPNDTNGVQDIFFST